MPTITDDNYSGILGDPTHALPHLLGHSKIQKLYATAPVGMPFLASAWSSETLTFISISVA